GGPVLLLHLLRRLALVLRRLPVGRRLALGRGRRPLLGGDGGRLRRQLERGHLQLRGGALLLLHGRGAREAALGPDGLRVPFRGAQQRGGDQIPGEEEGRLAAVVGAGGLHLHGLRHAGGLGGRVLAPLRAGGGAAARLGRRGHAADARALVAY